MVKLLKERRDEAARCSKCSICKIVLPVDVKSAQFSRVCPSGTRFRFDSYFASGKMEIARAIADGDLDYTDRLLHILYSCTGCGACNSQCYYVKGLKPLEIFEELKAKLVEDGFGPLPEHKNFASSVEQKHNAYNEPHNERLQWLKDKSVIGKQSDIGYYIGCTASYRTIDSVEAVANILNKLNVDFTVLADEWCCGSPLFRTGQRDLALKVMEHNLKEIENLGVKKLLFSCAGCIRTFKEDYEKYGGKYSFEPLHAVEFLAEIIDSIKLKEVNETVTYHDPCHLGRHLGVYDAPRKILSSIPGVKLVEMERIKEFSWCCGAGAGVKAALPDFALWSARERVEEAIATGATKLISCCPFCKRNLQDAIKKYDLPIEMVDLFEYIENLIE